LIMVMLFLGDLRLLPITDTCAVRRRVPYRGKADSAVSRPMSAYEPNGHQESTASSPVITQSERELQTITRIYSTAQLAV
jgi:hypothetical protein